MLSMSLQSTSIIPTKGKMRLSVPRFDNLDAFNISHFGLTGVWNMPLHRKSEMEDTTGNRVGTEVHLGNNSL